MYVCVCLGMYVYVCMFARACVCVGVCVRGCVCVMYHCGRNDAYVIPQPQFKSVMLYQFLHLLLQVLIQQSHGLLQEEICCCMYNMAAVDFNMFHTRFMADFLQRCEGITAEQRVEIASNYKTDEVCINLCVCGMAESRCFLSNNLPKDHQI